MSLCVIKKPRGRGGRSLRWAAVSEGGGVSNVLLCVIYQLNFTIFMLQQYHIIRGVQYNLRFHATVVGLATYYPCIWGHCNTQIKV
jgi:hypothetical protein